MSPPLPLPLLLLSISMVWSVKPGFYQSLTPALGLEKNASLEKINKYYQTLYTRLHKRDYGFALFGEKCETAAIDDYEDHLDMGASIIRDQEEDGKYRRAVEEHLRPKLRTFYYRSRNLCDFRKLLVCQSNSHRCACAHNSMGIGRKHKCHVNNGKRCDYNEVQLAELGIPSIPSENVSVSCVHNAECISSFGAASKVCKCKQGFYGVDCKPSMFRSMPSKKKGENEIGWKGRAFLEKPETDFDYFLYPEEIKKELVRLMTIRGLYSPAEREAEAEELYAQMEADGDAEEMVIRDIYLKRKANISSFGGTCDPSKQLTLDNPPTAKEGEVWVDPKPKDVKKWQEYLLKGSESFCNFVEFFRCEESTNNCECQEGLVYESGECRLSLGKECGDDYDGIFEFDPLKARKRFTQPFSPSCVSGANCELRPLFFTKQCACPEGKSCGNQTSLSRMASALNLEILVHQRFTLKLGQSCDPEAHKELFNPNGAQIKDYELRLATIKELLQNPKQTVRFCNLKEFLNCSSESKKCQCFSPLVAEKGVCRAKYLEACGENFPYGIKLFSGGIELWKMGEVFKTPFSPHCISSAKCNNETGHLAGKCICSQERVGELCDEPRSVYSSVLNPSNVNGYKPDKEINLVFHALNRLSYRMQNLMTLKYGSSCEFKFSRSVERIVKFYRDIASSDENLARSKTLYQYEKVVKWLMFLLERLDGQGPTELCNSLQGHSCHHISKTCACRNGTIYEGGFCKLTTLQPCDPKPSGSWIPACHNQSNCHPDIITSKHSCQCNNETLTGDMCTLIIDGNGNGTIGPGDGNNTVDPGIITTTSSPLTGDFPSFEEIKIALEDLMLKGLPLDAVCEMGRENILSSWFPILPKFYHSDYRRMSPDERREALSMLRSLNGLEFCDRKHSLRCYNGRCNCNAVFLVREGPECRLREGQHCGEIGTIIDENVPNLLCRTGTKCEKPRYGVHLCVRIITESELL